MKIRPVLLSPAPENVDGQGLLECQSHRCCPRAAIPENPFWVRGFALTPVQSRRLKPREREGMHPSHTAEKWEVGVGLGVWLAPSSACEALVQPVRLNLGTLNTHMQPGHCTHCPGWAGGEAKEERPAIWGRTLAILHWELRKGGPVRHLGPAGWASGRPLIWVLPQSCFPQRGTCRQQPGKQPGSRGSLAGA